MIDLGRSRTRPSETKKSCNHNERGPLLPQLQPKFRSQQFVPPPIMADLLPFSDDDDYFACGPSRPSTPGDEGPLPRFVPSANVFVDEIVAGEARYLENRGVYDEGEEVGSQVSLELDLFDRSGGAGVGFDRGFWPSVGLDRVEPDFEIMVTGSLDMEDEVEEEIYSIGAACMQAFVADDELGGVDGSDSLELRLGFGSVTGIDLMRSVGLGSGEDDGGEIVVAVDGAENGRRPLCWDCPREDDPRDRPSCEEPDWEVIDRRVLSAVIEDADEDDERSVVPTTLDLLPLHAGGGNTGEETEGMDWEVFLGVSNGDTHHIGDDNDVEEAISTIRDWVDFLDVQSNVLAVEHDSYPDQDFDYIHWIGQVTDEIISIKGRPPAAKSVIDSLPSVVLTQSYVEKNNTSCAVCKDELSLDDKGKKLPCLHHYHEECILPWLRIRNTCPVCRSELPTDDLDYESLKAQGSGHR